MYYVILKTNKIYTYIVLTIYIYYIAISSNYIYYYISLFSVKYNMINKVNYEIISLLYIELLYKDY